MAVRPLRLGTECNPGRYPALGRHTLVNLYAEDVGETGVAAYPLIAAVGSELAYTFSAGNCRGLHALSETQALGVYGTDIILIESAGSWSVVGVMPGSGPVTFATNRAATPETALVTPGHVRFFIGGTVSAPAVGFALPSTVVSCDELGRRIIYTCSDGRFFYSGLNDATTVTSLSYYEAESRADGLVRGIVLEGDLWLFGSESTEVWTLTSDSDDPYALRPGAAVDQGAIGADAVTLARTPQGVRVVWIASDHTVRSSDGGYTGRLISKPAIERDVAAAVRDDVAIASHDFEREGTTFFVLSCSRWTWVLNWRTGQWHQEASFGLSRRRWQRSMRWRGASYVGDYDAPKIYRIDPEAHTEAGDPIVCRLVTPPDTAHPHDIEYNALYIDLVSGSGITAAPSLAEEDPAVRVRWSWTNGQTWGSWRQLKTGKAGQFRRRISTYNVGTSTEDGGVFEIVWSASVARGITMASVDAQTVAA